MSAGTSKNIPDTADANAALTTARDASRKDHKPYEARHFDEVDWETIPDLAAARVLTSVLPHFVDWPGRMRRLLLHNLRAIQGP